MKVPILDLVTGAQPGFGREGANNFFLDLEICMPRSDMRFARGVRGHACHPIILFKMVQFGVIHVNYSCMHMLRGSVTYASSPEKILKMWCSLVRFCVYFDQIFFFLAYLCDKYSSWGSTLRENHRLHLLQKKAVRIITNSNYIAHTEPLLKELRLLKVTCIFSLEIWAFYYKLMNNQLPIYFKLMKPPQP